MRSLKAFIGVLLATAISITPVASSAPAVHFRVFAHTGLRLVDIVWTGRQFLYIENTTSRVVAGNAAGTSLAPFARMPRQVEETRCRLSPGTHGFVAGDFYCHAPDNRIYRISADGKQVAVIATLPISTRSDGALTFDTVGSFQYALIVATGRSGAATSSGGIAFALDATGTVRRVGSYHAPGGADEIVVAPASFGSASGQLLLAVDAGHTGSLVALSARGQQRTVATLPDGLNPLVVLMPGQMPAAGAAPAGLYVTDTLSRNVYVAPAADFTPFAGAVAVGSELRGLFWVVRPRGTGFTTTLLPTTLSGKHYNLEGATYIVR